MSDELKPCPMCGPRGDPGLARADVPAERFWIVCEACGLRGIRATGHEAAVVLWNRRGDEARIRAEAAAERTRAIVLALHEDAASWRKMATKMEREADRLMCTKRADIVEGRAYSIAGRYGVDGNAPDDPAAFPQPGSGK